MGDKSREKEIRQSGGQMKIKFVPTGQEIEGDPNKTLLQLCTENQIEIKSICKGVPSCAECRVKIIEGEHNIVPPSKAEMSLIGTNYFIDHRRLSCQVHCYGDITVDLSEQIERAEVQNKKVRGFRSPHQKGSQVETQAKQGTLILEEGTRKGPGAPHNHHEPHTPAVSVMAGHPEEGNAVIQQTEGREQVLHQGREHSRQQKAGGQSRGQSGSGRNQPGSSRDQNQGSRNQGSGKKHRSKGPNKNRAPSPPNDPNKK